MKTCTKCKEEKPFSEFSKGHSLGHASRCKACDKARHKAANELLTPAEREQAKENKRAYEEANKERFKKRKKAWNDANKEKVNARRRFRRATEPELREKDRARCKEYGKTHKEELKIKAKKHREANIEKQNKKSKEYYWNNKEKRQQYQKKYNKENREKINATTRVYMASPRGKQTYEANRENANEKRRKRQNERRKTDPLWRLQRVIGCSIRGSFRSKGFKKTSRTHEILGCSFEEFETYIENQFKEGMTWENYGEWELDHIVPKHLPETEEEVIAINHYSNFQPLWKEENGPAGKGRKLILDIISPENKIRYKDIISRNNEV